MRSAHAFPQRRVIVTGAAGFIGFHLTRRLLDDGVTVLGIDNLNPYYDPALKRARIEQLAALLAFRFEHCDLADCARIAALFSAAVSLPWSDLAAQAGVRVSLSIRRLMAQSESRLASSMCSRAAASRRAAISSDASSSSVYGGNSKIPFSTSDNVDHPLNLYGATKKANELMAHAYAHLFALPATGLRFSPCTGRGDGPTWRCGCSRKRSFGKPIRLFNHGQMKRDFTYIDDVVEALVRLIDRPPAAEGTSRRRRSSTSATTPPVPLDRFIAAIETATGRTAARIDRPMQPGDVEATYADVEALSDKVGFAPKTSIEDGIGRIPRVGIAITTGLSAAISGGRRLVRDLEHRRGRAAQAARRPRYR